LAGTAIVGAQNCETTKHTQGRSRNQRRWKIEDGRWPREDLRGLREFSQMISCPLKVLDNVGRIGITIPMNRNSLCARSMAHQKNASGVSWKSNQPARLKPRHL
jgi:hypothetical protein